jgi:glycosyltransferase involved in cell wall biosynthesis
MQIGFIIPTYNEKENIVELVESLLALPLDGHVIVVDDNSPDGTGQLVEALRARNERVHLIHRPAKLGLGTAHIAGMQYALGQGASYILTMDADFSHDPQYIPAMVTLAQENHVVIGSRYVSGGGVENWEWYRRFLSWSANMFARLILGLKANDCTAGFRCYRREVLLTIDLDHVFSNGYSFLLEMAYRCQLAGCSFGEVPIIFVNRAQGTSKISQKEIFKGMYTVIRLGAGRLLPRRVKTPSPATIEKKFNS